MREICLVIAFLFGIIPLSIRAQTTYVQIKTFDSNMQPMPDVGISINNGDFLTTNSDGLLFTNLPESDLPPENISIRESGYEAESWNYNRGILEIIIREKRYREIEITLLDQQNNRLPFLDIILDGPEKIIRTSTSDGTVKMPYPISRNFEGQWEYRVPGYEILEKKFTSTSGELILKQSRIVREPEPSDESSSTPKSERRIKLLPDSIRTMDGFYTSLKSIYLDELDPVEKQKMDDLFNQIQANQIDSTLTNRADSISEIDNQGDIETDMDYLLRDTEFEERVMGELRTTVQDRLNLLNNKISSDTVQLSESRREQLANDLDKVEQALITSEKMHREYIENSSNRISELRAQLLQLEGIEKELKESEEQRKLEQAEFRRRLLRILVITFILVALVILLAYLIRIIIRQRNQLKKINKEINYINANLEELVDQKTETLNRINKELDMFLYQSAHVLRGPLTTIIGLSKIAELSLTGESLALFHKTAETAQNMDKMLQKLRMVSHLNNPSKSQIVNFNELESEILKHFDPDIRKDKVHLDFEFDNNIKISTPPGTIEIMLRNLIENSIRYRKLNQNGDPNIKVKIFSHENGFNILVRDNGIGIDQGIKDRVWDMFFVGIEKGGGHGLGLYVVKKAVDTLNGTVEINSKLEEYTEIILWIPDKSKLHQGTN